MNKQEAIKRVEELYGYGSIAKTVADIISQIHEPQKVTVPSFIDSFIRYAKAEGMSLFIAMDNAQNKESEWIIKNGDTFACAWLDGYEIEQQLYTVEIPNPNIDKSHITVLKRMKDSDNDIELCVFVRPDLSESKFQLTESEIKKDFAWAWQFAKEVE